MNTNTRLIPSWVEPTANDIDNIRKEIERILEKYGQISLAECKNLVCRPVLISDYIRGWYAPCQVDMIFKRVNAKTCKWIIEMPHTVDISETANRREEIDKESTEAKYYESVDEKPYLVPDLLTYTHTTEKIDTKGASKEDILKAVMPSAFALAVGKNVEDTKRCINAAFGIKSPSSFPDWEKSNPRILREQEMKKDLGKPRLALVPPSLIESVGQILTFGAEKYEPNGWKRVAPERYKDAMVRHMCAYLRDENSVDEESGLSHLWHMTCNAAFLIDFKENENVVGNNKNPAES